jgi:hypothetical protein
MLSWEVKPYKGGESGAPVTLRCGALLSPSQETHGGGEGRREKVKAKKR